MFDVFATSFMTAARTETLHTDARRLLQTDTSSAVRQPQKEPQKGIAKRVWAGVAVILLSVV